MKSVDLEFLLRIFRATAFDNADILFWRTDGEYAPVTIFVICNDTFGWGCADLEEITPDNIGELEKALEDVKAANSKSGYIHMDTLFVSRVRKMRPQNAVYPLDEPEICKLLDECGPEREVGPGNPYEHWTCRKN